MRILNEDEAVVRVGNLKPGQAFRWSDEMYVVVGKAANMGWYSPDSVYALNVRSNHVSLFSRSGNELVTPIRKLTIQSE